MKTLKYCILSLMIIPFGVNAQENDGWFDFGNDENQEQNQERQEQIEQEQVEDTEIIDREQVDQQLQTEVEERDVQEGEKTVEVTETQRITQEVLKREQVPTVKVCNEYADVNAMDQKDFTALGFDKKSAENIVKKRDEQGRFSSVDEISQVQGVDQEAFSKIQGSLSTAQRQAQEQPTAE